MTSIVGGGLERTPENATHGDCVSQTIFTKPPSLAALTTPNPPAPNCDPNVLSHPQHNSSTTSELHPRLPPDPLPHPQAHRTVDPHSHHPHNILSVAATPGNQIARTDAPARGRRAQELDPGREGEAAISGNAEGSGLERCGGEEWWGSLSVGSKQRKTEKGNFY